MPLPGVERLCGAKCRDGHACTNPAMDNGRCRKHAGNAAKGVAASNFKTGRYSKYLPKDLMERYNSSIDDPELLNLRHDIALLDARLSQLLERVDTNQGKQVWEDARKCHDEIKRAMNNEDYGGVLIGLEKLDRAIGIGLADYDAWSEIEKIVDQRRKTVESEQKRLVAMNQVITTEQAMTLVAAITMSIKRNVLDPKALTAIQNDLSRFLTMPEQAKEIT